MTTNATLLGSGYAGMSDDMLELMDAATKATPPSPKAMDPKSRAEAERMTLDSAARFAGQEVDLTAANTVQEWAATSEGDLGEGEGLGDRLFALLAANSDADDMAGDESDDLGEDESEMFGMIAAAAWNYMAGKGVAEDDLDALFGDDVDASNLAGSRVHSFLADTLPGGDEAMEDANNFAFGPDALSNTFDGPTYKRRFVIRKGQKVAVRKRVSGRVRMSAAQKVAVTKMRRRSNSAAARMMRAKSMRVRKSRGM
jgi:hypothetical protein